MSSNTYVFTYEELQGHLNTAFINTITSLKDEKYLTQKECNDICSNYSIIIESNGWLPKAVAKWMGMSDIHFRYRLVKAVNRRGEKENAK
jgi:hypothetical protein